eukprot:TRINITY_DN14821_c0_g1_i1.p1 TRINITY_DN14821_c0_g1~~TRINITY_DN14821_c0_g1_i1.p1  ORF type:complete len:184 (+),score=21.45 TRINITY_DN14821_c0_g1_i1:464-1015(+)
MVRRLWAKYLWALRHRPLRTNVISAGLILSVGDRIAQVVEGGEKDHNFARSARLAVWGSLISAPISYYWFRQLERWWPASGGFKAALRKTVVNQLIMAPFLNALFFFYVIIWQDSDHSIWKRWQLKMSQEYYLTIFLSTSLWTPMHLFNFFVLPPDFRVVFQSVVLVLWTAYLSFVGHRNPSA